MALLRWKHVAGCRTRYKLRKRKRGASVPIDRIKDLMRHESIETTMIYRHLTPDHLAEAQRRGFEEIATW